MAARPCRPSRLSALSPTGGAPSDRSLPESDLRKTELAAPFTMARPEAIAQVATLRQPARRLFASRTQKKRSDLSAIPGPRWPNSPASPRERDPLSLRRTHSSNPAWGRLFPSHAGPADSQPRVVHKEPGETPFVPPGRLPFRRAIRHALFCAAPDCAAYSSKALLSATGARKMLVYSSYKREYSSELPLCMLSSSS